jgi:hypothetical protein
MAKQISHVAFVAIAGNVNSLNEKSLNKNKKKRCVIDSSVASSVGSFRMTGTRDENKKKRATTQVKYSLVSSRAFSPLRS